MLCGLTGRFRGNDLARRPSTNKQDKVGILFEGLHPVLYPAKQAGLGHVALTSVYVIYALVSKTADGSGGIRATTFSWEEPHRRRGRDTEDPSPRAIPGVFSVCTQALIWQRFAWPPLFAPRVYHSPQKNRKSAWRCAQNVHKLLPRWPHIQVSELTSLLLIFARLM
jgi:hypothetical protein